jgi:predicted site-specific integrase-resolvase
MKLSVWAQKQGIHYQTAWRMAKSGRLRTHRLPTGGFIVDEFVEGEGVALYARVSSADQRADLDAQVGRLAAYAAKEQLTVVKIVTEVGSGLNGSRRKLKKLLRDPVVQTIVVEHRDRLMRFGSEYLESVLQAGNRRLLVVNPEEIKDDLVQDMIAVLTSLCARLYGRRSAKNRAQRAVESLAQAVP